MGTFGLSIVWRGLWVGLIVSCLMGLGRSYAQGPAPVGETVVTFNALGVGDRRLQGPFSGDAFDFYLPMHWEVAEGSELQLSVAISRPGGAGGLTGIFGVKLDGVAIGSVLFDRVGERSVTLPISGTVWAQGEHKHHLEFRLETGEECRVGEFTTVMVRSASFFTLRHRVVSPITDLRFFVSSLYQQTILPDNVALVVGDGASAAELEAALVVAAGLGRATGGGIGLKLLRNAELTAALLAQMHLIFVGKRSTFAQLRAVQWPVAAQEFGFGVAAAVDDGVVLMAVSPWNATRVVLWVSGETDDGVVKAGRAVGSGQVQTGNEHALAIISAVQSPIKIGSPITVNRTLSDLGYAPQKLYGPGTRYTGFVFEFPLDAVTGEDPYFDLYFLHSALLDYDQSSLSASINDQFIGSVRFDDNSMRLATARLTIPQGAVHAGRNYLAIGLDMVPRARCLDPQGTGVWVTVRPESLLHLPFVRVQAQGAARTFNLGNYPDIFTVSGSLKDLTLVVPVEDGGSWGVAAAIAFQLGRGLEGEFAEFHVAFADRVSQVLRGGSHFILIGQPTKLPLLREMNDALPIPFAVGSDLPSQEHIAVAYPFATSSGFLQLFPSPWNAERTVLTILGGSREAIETVGRAFSRGELRSQLNGNVAIVHGKQVLSRSIAPRSASPPPPQITPPVSPQLPTDSSGFSWVPGTALLIAGLSLLIWSWRRRRSRSMEGRA